MVERYARTCMETLAGRLLAGHRVELAYQVVPVEIGPTPFVVVGLDYPASTVRGLMYNPVGGWAYTCDRSFDLRKMYPIMAGQIRWCRDVLDELTARPGGELFAAAVRGLLEQHRRRVGSTSSTT